MARNMSMKTHEWDSAHDPAVASLFLALQWAQGRSLEVMQPVLGKFGLSLAEFDVLATLRNAPPPHEMTPSQIQDEVVITSGGLTKIMSQLTTRGLVERRQNQDDLRIKPVRLSAEGKQTIEQAMSEMVGTTGKWLRAALSEDEMAVLAGLLRKLLG